MDKIVNHFMDTLRNPIPLQLNEELYEMIKPIKNYLLSNIKYQAFAKHCELIRAIEKQNFSGNANNVELIGIKDTLKYTKLFNCLFYITKGNDFKLIDVDAKIYSIGFMESDICWNNNKPKEIGIYKGIIEIGEIDEENFCAVMKDIIKLKVFDETERSEERRVGKECRL